MSKPSGSVIDATEAFQFRQYMANCERGFYELCEGWRATKGICCLPTKDIYMDMCSDIWFGLKNRDSADNEHHSAF